MLRKLLPVFLITAFALSSCSDAEKDEVTPESITGTWAIEGIDFNIDGTKYPVTDESMSDSEFEMYTYTLNEDGTYAIFDGEETINGTYEYSAENKTLNLVDEDYTTHLTVNLSGNSMELETRKIDLDADYDNDPEADNISIAAIFLLWDQEISELENETAKEVSYILKLTKK